MCVCVCVCVNVCTFVYVCALVHACQSVTHAVLREVGGGGGGRKETLNVIVTAPFPSCLDIKTPPISPAGYIKELQTGDDGTTYCRERQWRVSRTSLGR